MLYITKVKQNTQAFAQKVDEIAKKLQVQPDWLMLVMNSESRLNHRIQNPIGATGLIQFMPDTARSLGTTPEELVDMSNVEQLDYVYKYYKPYAGKIKSYYDLYLITFFPLGLGKPDNWVMETKKISASKIAKQNPAINKWVKDDKITIGEFKQYVKSTIPTNILSQLNDNKLPILVLVLVLGIALYLYN